MFDVSKLTGMITSTIRTTVTDATESVTSAVSERLGDLSTFDFTKLDVSKLEFPKYDLPKLDLPKVNLPQMDLARFEMPDVPAEVDRVADVVRDATYAGIGAVVIAAQMVDGRIRKLAGAAA